MHIQLEGSETSMFTVSVADGKCTVAVGLQGTPDATVVADADTYAAVALGKQRIEWAVLRRKIRIRGIPTMRTFSKLFKPPQ